MSNQLVEDNMNLVYYIVSREYPTYLGDEDIVQSGMVGLCKAAEYWNKEGQFSTYAGKCIRNEIRQEFIRRKKHGKTVSLEATVGEDCTLADMVMGDEDVVYLDDERFIKMLTTEEKEMMKLDSMGYSPEEIAGRCNCNTNRVWKILRLIQLKWRNFNEN